MNMIVFKRKSVIANSSQQKEGGQHICTNFNCGVTIFSFNYLCARHENALKDFQTYSKRMCDSTYVRLSCVCRGQWWKSSRDKTEMSEIAGQKNIWRRQGLWEDSYRPSEGHIALDRADEKTFGKKIGNKVVFKGKSECTKV